MRLYGTRIILVQVTLVLILLCFSPSILFAQNDKLDADEIIRNAQKYLRSEVFMLEDFACSTRTATFMRQELLDISQRYDIDKYAFTLVDDWATGSVYWKKPDKFKYLVSEYYRSQTWADEVMAPVDEMSGSVNGPFLFKKLKIISPLSDSCFSYYDYQLISIVTINNKKHIYEIGIIPRSNNISLVSGTIRIEDFNFSVTDMRISFRKRTKIRLPLRYDCEIKYMQLNKQYNVCYQIIMAYEFILPKIGKMVMLQKVDNWDFKINNGLSDALFDKHEIDIRSATSTLSTTPFSLSSLSQQVQNKVANSYKYSGKFAKLTSLWDTIVLNRIEGVGTRLGLKTEGAFSQHWRLRLNLGYGWQNKRYRYRLDFGHYIPYSTGLSYGVSVYNSLSPINPTVISEFANSIAFLISRNDYLDYYYKRGGFLFSQYNWKNNLNVGLKISREHHSIAIAKSAKNYRSNPKIEEGNFTVGALYSVWNSGPTYLPTSYWSISNQILFSVPDLNDNKKGFARVYFWLRRYQVLPLKLALEADVNGGMGFGHLPLQYKFVSIHDRYQFDKNMDYQNWYGDGAISCGVSFFFGEQLIEKLFLVTKLRFLTIYKIRLMLFTDVIRFYEKLPDVLSTETMFKGAWTTDRGLGIDGLNGLIRFEFSNRYIGLRIRPNFIPGIFR